MSGGSYDYAFGSIEDLAMRVRQRAGTDSRRLAFAALLGVVAKAAHDLEWVDSGDKSPGDEYAAIDRALAFGGADPIEARKAVALEVVGEILATVGLEVRPVRRVK